MIDGVIITPLKQIFDDRGKVMHMMRKDSPVFSGFGEIYFSTVYPGAVKAWNRHKRMTLNCAVIHGVVQFVLFDERVESKTYRAIQEIYLSAENYCLVTVPPLIWVGFKGIGDKTAILANCADIPHDPDEREKKLANDNCIPYKWRIN